MLKSALCVSLQITATKLLLVFWQFTFCIFCNFERALVLIYSFNSNIKSIELQWLTLCNEL
jgi:hypothetical protein